MDYRRGLLKSMNDIALRLRSADPSITLQLFKSYVSHDLACLLVDKVFAMSEDVHEEDEAQTVPSLVDLCAARVGSDKDVVDTLYAIYGPDTNFPFPSWVEPQVQEMSEVDDLESKFKLALLLSNNATIGFRFSSSYEDKETEMSKVLGPLLWKKLSSFSKRLQVVKARYDRDHEGEDDPPEFYQTENVLHAVQQLSNLRVLEVPQTVFLDADFQILGASLPQLKRFEFKFDGRVTKTGVQALGQLKDLEVLLFDPGDDDLMDLEDCFKIMDTFIARCLGILPWLKVVCTTVDDYEALFDHLMPAMEYGQVLSLVHMQITGCIKMLQEDDADNEKAIPFLRNVRFLKVVGLNNDEAELKKFMELEMHNLEELNITQKCEYHPVCRLVQGIGMNLSEVDLEGCNGAWNILGILDVLPVAKVVKIGGKGYYSFDDHAHLQHVSPNLEFLYVNLKNEDNCELPYGVLTRLLALPKMKLWTLPDLLIPVEECNEVALKVKSGALQLQNLASFTYQSGLDDDSSFLIAVLCIFCPNLRCLEILGARGPFREFLFVLSALLYPRISLNRWRLFDRDD